MAANCIALITHTLVSYFRNILLDITTRHGENQITDAAGRQNLYRAGQLKRLVSFPNHGGNERSWGWFEEVLLLVSEFDN